MAGNAWLGARNLYTSRNVDFLHPPPPPVTSPLYGPDTVLSIIFSKTPNLRPLRNVRDQMFHPQNTVAV